MRGRCGCAWWGDVWQGGVCGRGVCVAWGHALAGEGGHA